MKKNTQNPGVAGQQHKIEIPNVLIATGRIIEELERKSTGFDPSYNHENARRDKIPKKLT